MEFDLNGDRITDIVVGIPVILSFVTLVVLVLLDAIKAKKESRKIVIKKPK